MSRVVKVKDYYSFLAGHRIVYEFSKFPAFRAECHIGSLGGLKRYYVGPLDALKRPLSCLKCCHIGPLSCFKRFSGIVTGSEHCVPLSIGNRTIPQDADNNQGLKDNLPTVSALLSAFIGASVIFYAFWIPNFDDRQWLGVLLADVSGLESALSGSPTTHAFPVPPAPRGEDDVESIAEPFFGLSRASDVIVVPFSNPLIFPSGAGRCSRCTESFQAGKTVFGTSRQQCLRLILSLQVCRTPPTFARNRLRYRAQKKSAIVTKERPYQLARYYE